MEDSSSVMKRHGGREGSCSPVKRSRTTSRVALEELYRLLDKTILEYQHPVTGLLPAFLFEDGTPGWAKNDAWVRDNVYSVLSIWGMSIAYRRQADMEDDRLKAHQLEQSVVKLMRSLLLCMMSQVDKVEAFKKSHDNGSALHAKYNLTSCSTAVGDYEWGHLQIDATSLFLLTLAEMTAAGLQIIFTLDEVAFVQNLVFYIEDAYRIPDYGIWERGDKSNHGVRELNASSIGMAKAALEAISGLDLFGASGGQASIIHVMHDQVAQCNAKLTSLLPRESSSKEVDASLLTILGYPAFAVESPELISATKDKIISKLMGEYGCRRFLRDGYQTVKEDSSRLHYEPAELKVFENIECEWPLFFILFWLDGLISGDSHKAREYRCKLHHILPEPDDSGIVRVPELFYVPQEKVEQEYLEPHSQSRVTGVKVQHMWSQSLYILCQLLQMNFINIGEVDPLNRRLCKTTKPDTLVQVVVLAEDQKMRSRLKNVGIMAETIQQVELARNQPVKILPFRHLMNIYKKLGVSRKMGLTGRPLHSLGVIATSQLYSYALHSQHMFAFTPQFLDYESFYLSLDHRLLVDLIRTDLAYLKSNWRLMGRPTIVLPILRSMLRGGEGQWERSPILKLLNILASGYSSGVRVKLGKMKDFLSTACVKKLSFIDPSEAGEILDIRTDAQTQLFLKHHRDSLKRIDFSDTPPVARKVFGSMRRSRQTPGAEANPHPENLPIKVTSDESPEIKVALAWAKRDDLSPSNMRLPVSTSEATMTSPSSTSSVTSLSREHYNSCEVIEKLQHESNIFLQGDYLNHIYNTHGRDFTMTIRGQECTVGILLEELYKKASASNLWGLIRHVAGMLHKRVEDLGPAATDLLVRQKIISVGQPPNEIHIAQPCTSVELLNNIVKVCRDDYSAIALTQEILVFLAMFIRSEPELFDEMLRLRVGLIRNVMVLELSRTMNVSQEDAVEKLLDLSPYDLKHLLHLIFSSKEFTVDEINPNRESVLHDGQLLGAPVKQLSIVAPSKKRVHGELQRQIQKLGDSSRRLLGSSNSEESESGHGHWQRRRRLDGALNRVPPNFYSDVWHILERCSEIDFGTGSRLPQYPTIQEMTPGELKFALTLEGKLNSLPHPEYRQLVVEALIIFGFLAKSKGPPQSLSHGPLVVGSIIKKALDLFLEDQRLSGCIDFCCQKSKGSCKGPAGICIQFYDSAPGGRFGTMNYLSQAVANQLRELHLSPDQCKIT